MCDVILPDKNRPKTVWQCIKEFINSTEIDDLISTRDLTKYVFDNLPDDARFSNRTISYFKNMCAVNSGYLEHHCSGLYYVRKHIDWNLTSNELRKQYNPTQKK